ncbi:MAG: tyrosine-type recombinase/integrase [Paracoccaceae bacterium]
MRIHLLPFFGSRPLSEVSAGLVQEYRVHRLSGNARKPPSRSTLHHEIVTIRQVLKTAIRHNWLTHLPDLSMPYGTAGKITHRAWFSLDEYRQLYEATRRRVQKAKGKSWQWAAEQLHDYVLFMANTGLRPDEANNLEYRDIDIVDDYDSGETILEIEVRGKRGVGYCKSTIGAVRPFERLTKRNSPDPTDRVFPANHKKQFNSILAEENLKLDRDGNRRTAYSLRHTYVCLRLLEGADIYQIAKNCRTSVEMIEKYYASHLKTQLDASAINVRKPRKPVHAD